MATIISKNTSATLDGSVVIPKLNLVSRSSTSCLAKCLLGRVRGKRIASQAQEDSFFSLMGPESFLLLKTLQLRNEKEYCNAINCRLADKDRESADAYRSKR